MVVTTSLARQVKNLKGRATGTDIQAVQRGNGRASLLFSPGNVLLATILYLWSSGDVVCGVSYCVLFVVYIRVMVL